MSFEETYIGETVSTSNNIEAKLFNKIAQNTRVVGDRLNFHGCKIEYSPSDARRITSFNQEDDYDNTGFEVPMDLPVYDSGGFFIQDQPGRIYIPEGFSYAEAYARVRFNPGNWQIEIKRSGSSINSKSRIDDNTTSNNSYRRQSAQTTIVSVTPGDYFSLFFVDQDATPESLTLEQTFSATYGGSLVQGVSQSSEFVLQVRAYK